MLDLPSLQGLSLYPEMDTEFLQKENRNEENSKETFISNEPITKILGLLQKEEGLFLGERHDNLIAKNFLISNMDKLKSAGVETIYMEMIKHEDQYIIDDYLQDKEGSDKILLDYLIDRRNYVLQVPYGYFKIIETAKKHGIRIVGIDIKEPKIQRSFDNKYRESVINQDRVSHTGKYLVFGGSEHGNDVHYDTKFFNIDATSNPGVHIALGIQTIDFYKTCENKHVIHSGDGQDCDYIITSNIEDITTIFPPDKSKTCLGYDIFLDSIIDKIGNMPGGYADDYDNELKGLFDNYIIAIKEYKASFTNSIYEKLEKNGDVFYKSASEK